MMDTLQERIPHSQGAASLCITNDPTSIANPMAGALAEQLICSQCRTRYPAKICRFLLLGLTLPQPLARSADLHQIISSHAVPDQLQGVCCRVCSAQRHLGSTILQLQQVNPDILAHLRQHCVSPTTSLTDSGIEELAQHACSTTRCNVLQQALLEDTVSSRCIKQLLQPSGTLEPQEQQGLFVAMRLPSELLLSLALQIKPTMEQVSTYPEMKANFLKITSVARWPQCLVLHINRFDRLFIFTFSTFKSAYIVTRTLSVVRVHVTASGHMQKSGCHVQFPEVLDGQVFNVAGMSWASHTTDCVPYRLVAVVSHFGSTEAVRSWRQTRCLCCRLVRVCRLSITISVFVPISYIVTEHWVTSLLGPLCNVSAKATSRIRCII
jgi:hypothetical protein